MNRTLLPFCFLLPLSCGTTEVTGPEVEGSDPAECKDGQDNDGDGFEDCADQDCVGVSVCIEGDAAADCFDDIDNDLDGYTDCADQDCWQVPGCSEGDADTDADSDADSDADGDSDTDADTDADTDSDADADVQVFINEILASNNTVNADEDGGYDDWVELYNAGEEEVRLGDFSLTSDLSAPDACPLDRSLVIEPGGFLLLWADATPDQGEDHICFELSRSGGELGLFHEDGTEVDSMSFEAQESDISYARYPDGDDHWRQDMTPTPGATNR